MADYFRALIGVNPRGAAPAATTTRLEKADVEIKPVGAHARRTIPSDALAASAVFQKAVKKVPQTYVTGSPAEGDVPIACSFVSAAYRAYSGHHGLRIRPDDVWQAVLIQFSFYVQARAEKLRGTFVAHEGQKELVVHADGTLFSAPWTEIGDLFVGEIRKNIKDPSVADWLVSDFTTTTTSDRIASIVSVMATFQAYFSYKFCLCCGLPWVELEGTAEDWDRLLAKVGRLPDFDAGDGELIKWHGELLPVVAEMVATKHGKDNMDWWQRIATHVGGGSGPSYLSGWITTFCCFTHEGKWQGDIKQRSFYSDDQVESEWPIIDTDDVPTAVLVVPMKIDDNGTPYTGTLAAGQMTTDVVADGTALAPRNDWALYVRTAELVPAAAHASATASASAE